MKKSGSNFKENKINSLNKLLNRLKASCECLNQPYRVNQVLPVPQKHHFLIKK